MLCYLLDDDGDDATAAINGSTINSTTYNFCLRPIYRKLLKVRLGP